MTATILTDAGIPEGKRPGGRWAVASFVQYAYLSGMCPWCGTGGGINAGQSHRAAACLACGTVQCNSSDTCRACIHGWMPDWSRAYGARGYDPARRLCGYRGCDNPAVAGAPRVGRVCAACLHRPKVNGQPLGELIDQYRRIALGLERDPSGSTWRRMTYREPAA